MAHTVNIFGLINDSHVGIIRSAISALVSDSTLTLEIIIDSTGGNPDYAKCIFDLLEPYRNRVTCITHAKCMSSAVLIYLAGDVRLASNTAQFMIHPTSWTLYGTHNFLRMYASNNGDLILTLAEVYTLQALLNTAASTLVEIEQYTDEIFLNRANLPTKQFNDRRTIKTDQNFTAAESLQYGITTKLI